MTLLKEIPEDNPDMRLPTFKKDEDDEEAKNIGFFCGREQKIGDGEDQDEYCECWNDEEDEDE